jgi:hypothetical protein
MNIKSCSSWEVTVTKCTGHQAALSERQDGSVAEVAALDGLRQRVRRDRARVRPGPTD